MNFVKGTSDDAIEAISKGKDVIELGVEMYANISNEKYFASRKRKRAGYFIFILFLFLFGGGPFRGGGGGWTRVAARRDPAQAPAVNGVSGGQNYGPLAL